MAARHLNLMPEEWDALPWWQQRMFVEGYEEEGLIENDEGSSIQRTTVDLSVASSGDFGVMGFTEISV